MLSYLEDNKVKLSDNTIPTGMEKSAVSLQGFQCPFEITATATDPGGLSGSDSVSADCEGMVKAIFAGETTVEKDIGTGTAKMLGGWMSGSGLGCMLNASESAADSSPIAIIILIFAATPVLFLIWYRKRLPF